MSTPKLIPRVPGPAVLRNLREFWARPVGFFADAYQRYGSVFRFEIPTGGSTVVAGSLARKVLLETPGKCPMSRTGLFRPFTEEVGVTVFDTTGEPHKRVRALLRLPYSRQITAQFVPQMQSLTADFAANLAVGESVDLFAISARLAQYAMMNVVTPINLQGFAADFSLAGNRVMYAQFRLLPEASLKLPGYRRARQNMQNAIDEAIRRHQNGEFKEDPRSYMIDACLAATNSDGDTMDAETIRGVCFYALAGTEIYMGRQVGFMLTELLKNKSYLSQVLAEIDAVAPDADLSDAFRRMPHLRAAYLESLRCYPLIPGYSYVADEDTQLDGFAIKKNDHLIFAPYLSHFSPENFANPSAFDPTRHLPPRREFARAEVFSPFGVGVHACAAPGMVEILTLSIVASFLAQLELALERPTQPLTLQLSPLIAPRDPVRAVVIAHRTRTTAGFDALSESPEFAQAIEASDESTVLPIRKPLAVAPGQWLIRQGEVADAFYVLLEGTASVWSDSRSPSDLTSLPPGAQLAELEPGACFGEIGLLKNIPRTASVRMIGEGLVLRFDKEDFSQLIARYDLTAHDLRSIYYARHVKNEIKIALPGLASLVVPGRMQQASFDAGEFVFRQGAESDAFYIVLEGEADVVATGAEGPVSLARLGPGEFFGEMGLLRSETRSASVLAHTELKLIRIEREVFLETVARSPEALWDLTTTVCQRLLTIIRQEA